MHSLKYAISIGLFLCSLSWANDFDVIKSRMASDLVLVMSEQNNKDLLRDVLKWHQTIKSDGTWDDVKYHLDDNQFSPGEHAKRMDWMSRAYKSPEAKSAYLNPSIREAILSSFDAWISLDIQSYNWWHNEIGIPQRFTRTMLLMEKELGRSRIAKGIKFLKRVKIQKTGQNRLWYSEIVLTRGLFENNTKDVKLAVDELQSILKINSPGSEGIQVDYSFHQHGALIYNGGYGAKFSADMARLVYFFANTRFQFSRDKIHILNKYILDAQVWMTRGNKWDYSVVGRELARPKKDAYLLANACKLLSQSAIPRQNEYKKCLSSLVESKNYLKGNRSFFRSDYMVQQDPKFFSSVRMYSNRTLNNDAPSNGEGLLSHHLADGGMFVMQRGDEYEDIFPVWDWRHIPGTTTEIKKLKPASYTPGDWDSFAHIRYFGHSSYVGSVSNQKTGMAAMDFISNKNYEKLNAKKAWVMTENGVWAAGNDIECKGCDHAATTIDQKILRGPVFIKMSDGAILEHVDERSYEDTQAIYHDGITYYFKYPQSVTVSTKKQSGSWGIINQQYSKKDVLSKNVFKLWINHVKKGADVLSSYEYEILPGTSLDSFKNFNHVKKLSLNDSQIIAKYDERQFYAAVFKAGSFKIGKNILEVSAPCLLMYNVSGELVVSDPTQKLSKITIRVNDKKTTLALPQGDERGSSLKIRL